MRDRLLIFAIAFAGGLAGANVQPILSGAGKLIFPEASPSAKISASSGALTVAAGGTNQPVTLSPSGTGSVVAGGPLAVSGAATITGTSASAGTTAGALALVTAGTTHGLRAGIFDSNHGWIQLNDSLPLLINPLGGSNVGIGGTNHGSALDVTGDANVSGVFRQSGTAGQSTTITVIKTVSGTGVTFTTCTITYQGGIKTGGTCT